MKIDSDITFSNNYMNSKNLASIYSRWRINFNKKAWASYASKKRCSNEDSNLDGIRMQLAVMIFNMISNQPDSLHGCFTTMLSLIDK